MAKLILTLDGKVIDQYFINKPGITIGRDAGNDITIDDHLLSRTHIRITQLGDDDIVEDLQSKNGTRINGRPLDRHILQHRDVIELGKHHLRYVSSRMASDLELERTMIIQSLTPDTENEVMAGKIPEPGSPIINLQPDRTSRPRLAGGSVTILAGETALQAGENVPLNRVVTTFGVPGSSLVVLTRRPQGVFITHVEGPNFPIVGGQSIGASPRQLHDGDLIKAAGHELKFSAEPTPQA